MIVTVVDKFRACSPDFDPSFRIKVTPTKLNPDTKVVVKGSQLLSAGFKEHPYGAPLQKDRLYWLSTEHIIPATGGKA